MIKKISGSPCPKIFNRTLHEKFQSTPQTLPEIHEPINRTLLNFFQAGPGSEKENGSEYSYCLLEKSRQ